MRLTIGLQNMPNYIIKQEDARNCTIFNVRIAGYTGTRDRFYAIRLNCGYIEVSVRGKVLRDHKETAILHGMYGERNRLYS